MQNVDNSDSPLWLWKLYQQAACELARSLYSDFLLGLDSQWEANLTMYRSSRTNDTWGNHKERFCNLRVYVPCFCKGAEHSVISVGGRTPLQCCSPPRAPAACRYCILKNLSFCLSYYKKKKVLTQLGVMDRTSSAWTAPGKACNYKSYFSTANL